MLVFYFPIQMSIKLKGNYLVSLFINNDSFFSNYKEKDYARGGGIANDTVIIPQGNVIYSILFLSY